MNLKTDFIRNTPISESLLVIPDRLRLFSIGIFALLMLGSGAIMAQPNCTVNSGVNRTICDTRATLFGSIGGLAGTVGGAPMWSFVSGPTTPTIVTPNMLTSDVTGMTMTGNYIFRISLPCTNGDTATQDVTLTAYPEPAGFLAEATSSTRAMPLFLGDSIACGGSYQITDASPVPSGYTAMWTAFNNLASGQTPPATNLQIINPTSATPTVVMTDPTGYNKFLLRYTLTSADGVCTYTRERWVDFCSSFAGLDFRDNERCRATSLFVRNARYDLTRTNNIGLIIHSGPDSNLTIDSWTKTRIVFDNYQIGAPVPYEISIIIDNPCCNEVDTLGRYLFHNLGLGPVDARRVSTYSGYYCIPDGLPDSLTGYFVFPNDPNGFISSSNIFPTGLGLTTRIIDAPGDTIKPYVIYFDSAIITTARRIDLNFLLTGEDSCTISLPNAERFEFVDDSVDPRNIPDMVSCDYNPNDGHSVEVYLAPNVVGTGGDITNISWPNGATRIANMRTTQDTVILNTPVPGTYVFVVTQLQNNTPLPQAYYDCANNGYRGIDTFEVTFLQNFGANAGTDQQYSCSAISELVGNRVPGAQYSWTLLSRPAGSSVPVLTAPDSSNTRVTGVDRIGVYRYEYSITNPTGQNCDSRDTVELDFLEVRPLLTASVTSDEFCPGGTGEIVAGITAANGTMGPYTYTLYSADSSQVYTNMTGTFTGLTHGDYVVSATTSDTMCITDPISLSIGDSLSPVPYLTLMGIDSCSGSTYSVSYISDADVVLANGVLVTGGVISGVPVNMDIVVRAYNTDSRCDVVSMISAPGGCATSCVNPIITAGQGVCDGMGSGTYSLAYTVQPAAAVITVNGVINTSGIAQANIGDSIVIEATVGACVSRVTLQGPPDCRNICNYPSLSAAGAACVSLTTYSVSYSTTTGAVVTASAGTLTPTSVENIPVGTPLTIESSLPSCPDTQRVTIQSPDCSNVYLPALMLADPCSCTDTLNISVGGVYYFHDVLTISGFQGIVPDSILLGMTSNIYLRTGDSVFVYDPADSVAFDMVSPGVFQIDLWVPSRAQASGNVVFVRNGIFEPRAIPRNLLASCNRAHCITIPTLGEWGLMILGLLLLIVGVVSYGYHSSGASDGMLRDMIKVRTSSDSN